MGLGAPSPAPVKKVNAFIGTGVKTTSATSYTFSAQSIGAASPFRRLVVGIAATAGSGNPDLSSTLTCDGVSMTNMGTTNSGGGFVANVAFYTIMKPTGTTANFVLSFTAAPECCAIAVWTEEGYETAPLAYSSSQDFGTQNQSWSVNEIAEGIMYGIVVGRNSTVRTHTWTGLTEDFDTTIKASTASFSGARKSITATAATTPSESASGTQSKGCGRVNVGF